MKKKKLLVSTENNSIFPCSCTISWAWIWWDCGEPYTMPAVTNITCADGQRDICLPGLTVVWEDGSVGMDGSSHPELLHYLCSELREQDQPKSYIDIWSFYVYSHFIERLCGLSAILKSEFFFLLYFRIQEINPKDLVFVWVTLRAWLSNFLAETGLRIHSCAWKHWHCISNSCDFTDLRTKAHKEGKCLFMKISKRLEVKAQLIWHPNQKDTKQKIGNNYLLVYEISW